ncbi:uncharacterized protein LOC115876583 [Sitophilus oryzae]|uniref:Uncharacterized protein LOC115876583 n=1 Tax=Sitophilus oryzae TaxID=7048 RepID=A0A6J2XAT1_SITOR|nr:uncharacterized protein LOC115876583 [Sitophilus oryzae]
MNSHILFLVVSIITLAKYTFSEDEGSYTFLNTVRYPYSAYYDPFMGLIIALAIKLTPSEIDADLAWNIEANYFLPQNESEYTFPPLVPSESTERQFFERSMLYKIFEMELDAFSEKHGGKNCFLRILCEMACYSTKDSDILGDIIHILLSPSSSVDKKMPHRYTDAENYGKKNSHCKKYAIKCPINILNFFTVLGDILENKYIG